MIAEVTGTVTSLGRDTAVVVVGGIGLRVVATAATLARLRVGQSATLATALVVREDSLTLYGFGDAAERELFEVLQTATGVGPRLAQAVLGVHPPEAVRRAVATEDLTALTAVPGVGRKLAQRLVLELKDRIEPPSTVVASAEGGVGGDVRQEVRGGLISLGYGAREADEALALAEAGGLASDAEAPAALRAALAVLRRG